MLLCLFKNELVLKMGRISKKERLEEMTQKPVTYQVLWIV